MKIHTSPILRRGIQDFLHIYYCAVFFVYGTSVIIAFWELPTLLLRFSISDVIGFFAYQLTFSLFESLLATLFTLTLAYLLPMTYIKENRAEAGGLLIISFTISSLLFKFRRILLDWLLVHLPILEGDWQQIVFFLWLFSILSLPIIAVTMIKYGKVSNGIRSFAENSSVLAMIYTVLSFVGIVIVIFRDLV